MKGLFPDSDTFYFRFFVVVMSSISCRFQVDYSFASPPVIYLFRKITPFFGLKYRRSNKKSKFLKNDLDTESGPV